MLNVLINYSPTQKLFYKTVLKAHLNGRKGTPAVFESPRHHVNET